jgi:hypothetical protein
MEVEATEKEEEGHASLEPQSDVIMASGDTLVEPFPESEIKFLEVTASILHLKI